MSRSSKLAAALLSAILALSLAASAAAAEPNWPENYRRYFCAHEWPDGSGGTSLIWFTNLPSQAHVFPDGNQLKRGVLHTRLADGYQFSEKADLAWKPKELPDPPRGTNFELTLPRAQPEPIQCKRFENYGDFRLEFFECSNEITQTCTRIWP